MLMKNIDITKLSREELENIDKTTNIENLLPWSEEIKNKFGIIK